MGLRRRTYLQEAEDVVHDRSDHPTVVEYAIRYLFKGKHPAAAAKATVKKLSGFRNLFLGSGITVIDPEKLEDAILDRLADEVIKGVKSSKKGSEHFVLDGILQNFRIMKLMGNPSKSVLALRKKLKKRVIKKMGRDPFLADDKKRMARRRK